jgi:hypothetical protein
MIAVSGNITDALRANAGAEGINELISKPHEIEERRDAEFPLPAQRQAIKPAPA